MCIEICSIVQRMSHALINPLTTNDQSPLPQELISYT